MMTAPHPNRREEILDAAERRFTEQGFLDTTIAELIDDLGIAKGTFYHHFPSKEAVMTAVIDRHVEHFRVAAEEIAARSEPSAFERLLMVVGGGLEPREHAQGIAERLAEHGSELMHLRALNESVRALTPAVARLLEASNAEGATSVADPRATAAVLLTITSQLVDRDLLGWVAAGDSERLVGLLAAVEQLLGTAPGALLPIASALASPDR